MSTTNTTTTTGDDEAMYCAMCANICDACGGAAVWAEGAVVAHVGGDERVYCGKCGVDCACCKSGILRSDAIPARASSAE